MAKLFDGVSSIEGLIGLALTLAFVILAIPYVRRALSSLSNGDPVVSTFERVVDGLSDLSDVMRSNTDANNKQVEQFAANNELFGKIISDVKAIKHDMSEIRSDIHDELVRQRGEREARK